jgi:hypothetical protein
VDIDHRSGHPFRRLGRRGRNRLRIPSQTKSGQYQYLVRVYPVLRDPSKSESLYWAYPWDIEDIVLDRSGALLATFTHDLVDDGEATSPPWQKRIPAVLFEGRTTQPDMKVPRLNFDAASLPSLRRQGGNSVKPKPSRR